MARVVVPVVALLALLAGVEPASAQLGKLYPVDEAADVPDFFSFRSHLIQAVARRDTAALYATLASNILNSFGGDGGVEEFKAKWRPGDADSELWGTLAQILSLGGAFDGDTLFGAPYTFRRFPAGFEPFDHVVVVGSSVRVRAEPSVKAEVLATVSFDILPVARDVPLGPDAIGWEAVRLNNDVHGFIDSRYVRSPVGYRVIFIRRGGRWLIRSLVAGD
jgi:hypothetical protein